MTAHPLRIATRNKQFYVHDICLHCETTGNCMFQRVFNGDIHAAGCDGEVPPFLRVHEMAAVLARAQTIVGLDTGFTHLAAAMGKPTLGIYCDHEPGLAGITGPGRVASIGSKGILPTRNEVMALLEQQIAGAASPQSTY